MTARTMPPPTFNVHEAASRWIAGEPMAPLAKHYCVSISTMRRQLHAHGYGLPHEEVLRRQVAARARARAKLAPLSIPKRRSTGDALLEKLRQVHP